MSDNRDQRLQVNVTESEKQAIEAAAVRAHRSVSDFCRLAALVAAERQLVNGGGMRKAEP